MLAQETAIPTLLMCMLLLCCSLVQEIGVIGNLMAHAQEVVKMGSKYQVLREGKGFVLVCHQNLLLVLHVKGNLNRSSLVFHK